MRALVSVLSVAASVGTLFGIVRWNVAAHRGPQDRRPESATVKAWRLVLTTLLGVAATVALILGIVWMVLFFIETST